MDPSQSHPHPQRRRQQEKTPKQKRDERIGLHMDRNMRSRLWRALVAEFIGTTILVFFATASVVVQTVGGTATVSQNLLAGIVQGFCVAALVYTLAKTSGGHINPAVTVSLLIAGGMPLISGALYIIAQCAGGIAGAALLSAVMPGYVEGALGTTTLANGISRFQGFLFELIVTFLLAFVVLGTGTDPDATGTIKSLAPIPIGFSVVVGVAIAFGFTGGSLNPARTLGPALISNTWDSHYIYWAGPIGGAILAGLLYRFVFHTKPVDTEDDDSDEKRHDDDGKKVTGQEMKENKGDDRIQGYPAGDANV